jgi:hypothetical protein
MKHLRQFQEYPEMELMERFPNEPAEVWRAIEAFGAWLEKHGYASHDPYDVWGTAYGLFSRRLFYSKSALGLPFIAPILALEILCPQSRALLVRKERFATADAQLLLAFLNLHQLTGDPVYLEKARGLGKDLLSYSIPGYQGLCWGYPFDWQGVFGLSPRNMPYITTTPYCFEAFLKLHDITGQQDYLDSAQSVAEFVANDIKDTPCGKNSAAGSYTPEDNTKVVNASAYRAMVLFEAARRFDQPGYAEKAGGNLRFILESQRADGSWLYNADNPKEAFIDHFHTCFVLKNLCKINVHLQDAAVQKAIESGYGFYRSNLFDAANRPKSFALEPRTQITRLEMYNYAEAITLGSLLRGQIPEAFAHAQQLAEDLCRHYQCTAGHFVTRVYIGGWRHTFPFLRWPQAQLFYALTNLLKTASPARVSDAASVPCHRHPTEG